MRKLLVGAAAVVGLLASDSTASAQFRRTIIRDSGNGVNNTIVARNGGPGHFPAPGGFHPGFHPGFGHPDAGFGYGGGGFFPGGPGFGGVSKNVIQNSGNGVGNTIVAGGGGFRGSFFGGGVFPGGVNVNVVTNSGNGAGNRVISGGGAPGGLNINVVTNSGNGVGNVIRTR